LGDIKSLAGQTLWYGIPTIASRFLGYLLNIILFWMYQPSDTAYITQVYAFIPFLNILFTYGLETSYFRFIINTDKEKLYNTLMISLMITSSIFMVLVLWQTNFLAHAINLPDHPEYIMWTAWILFFDTLATLPFARLRQEGRPRRFAFIKVTSIVINMALVIFFLKICPKLYEQNPTSIFFFWYNPEVGIGYYIIANIIASFITLLFLAKELGNVQLRFDAGLWRRVMNYSYPLIIVGLGGMINEMLSRLVYVRVLDLPKEEELRQLGIFGANYKLAVLITIFIQVFRMAAEPFFFNQSADKNAPRTYSRVMKFFVIACCFMWLAIVTNLEVIKYLGYGKNAAAYAEGLVIIPVLSMGSVFLGIYYNLSVWYKLTNRTLTGAWITLAGAAITIVLNIWWIPLFGYLGSAWATLACYAFMMLISYLLGQKHYHINYPVKKLFAYIAVVVIMFFIHYGIIGLYHNLYLSTFLSLVFILLFLLLIIKVEKKELQKIPFARRFIKQ
jgi:O-antigen/teichoic acid export membrane protein